MSSWPPAASFGRRPATNPRAARHRRLPRGVGERRSAAFYEAVDERGARRRAPCSCPADSRRPHSERSRTRRTPASASRDAKFASGPESRIGEARREETDGVAPSFFPPSSSEVVISLSRGGTIGGLPSGRSRPGVVSYRRRAMMTTERANWVGSARRGWAWRECGGEEMLAARCLEREEVWYWYVGQNLATFVIDYY